MRFFSTSFFLDPERDVPEVAIDTNRPPTLWNCCLTIRTRGPIPYSKIEIYMAREHLDALVAEINRAYREFTGAGKEEK